MVKRLTFVLMLLTSSTVQAQALALKTRQTECSPQGCRQLTGTGACAYIGNIDERSIYLTAAHNVLKAESIQIGYGGKWWTAIVKFKQYDQQGDYAILETADIQAPGCFGMARKKPAHNVEARAIGYSQGFYNMRILKARIIDTHRGRYFSKQVAPGDSGGPVLVGHQIVGVIKGYDATGTVFTDCTLIRQRIENIYGRLPGCHCEPSVIKPEPAASHRVANLEQQISILKAEIDKLNQTKIPVWIMDAEGKAIAKQTYPLGDPIKLRFKAVKQSEAK